MASDPRPLPEDPSDLSARWRANEAELARLSDLPSGAVDPAERERQLDGEQDEIEGRLGEAWLRENRRDPQGEGQP